jgi:hypothetical protein
MLETRGTLPVTELGGFPLPKEGHPHALGTYVPEFCRTSGVFVLYSPYQKTVTSEPSKAASAISRVLVLIRRFPGHISSLLPLRLLRHALTYMISPRSSLALSNQAPIF